MDDLSNYRGNSRNQSEEPAEESRPRMERVISTPPRVRKKGAWSRVRTIFFEDDARSVGAAVFDEVIIPKIKDLLFDVVTEGTHRSLYRGGGNRRDVGVGRRSVGHTPYNRPNTSRPRERERDERPELDRRDRSLHDFTSITFRNAGEAEAVADRLADHVREYGAATVADFYDGIGLTADFPDVNYGWTDLRAIKVRRVRDGYILDLPRPEQLDKN